VIRLACNHEERHPLSYIRSPPRHIIKPKRYRRGRRIIPDDSKSSICNYKGNTYTLPRRSVVVMRAANHMAPPIEIPFLVLSQAVVVLVLRRSERSTELQERRTRSALAIQDIRVSALLA